MVSTASIAVKNHQRVTIFPRFPPRFSQAFARQVTLRAGMAPCQVRTAAALFHRGHPAPNGAHVRS